MKISLSYLSALLATSEAASFSSPPPSAPPVGLHSQYKVTGTDEFVNIFLPDYVSDIVHTFEVSSNFTPSVHYQRGVDRKLLQRDVCAYVTDCAGAAYSSLATFAAAKATITVDGCAAMANGINTYLSEGEYAVSKQVILGGVIVGIIVNLGTLVPAYFLNAKLEATFGNSKSQNDVCGEKDPAVFTSNAASAIYEFCISIQTELAEQATANYDVLDTTNGLGTDTGGFEGRAKMFISEQAATWGDVCHDDYGVDWKSRIRRNWNDMLGGLKTI